MNQLQLYMPPPTNWQDFQTLVAEIVRVKYAPNPVQEYGRQGQNQNGVDVFATDDFNNKIGIQCKETKVGGLTTVVIDKEAAKASNFSPRLNLFIVATTDRTNAKIQNHVIQLNDLKRYPFRIQVWFWDDLNNEINRSHKVMSSFYATLLEQFGKEAAENHLAGIRLAFDRPAFTDNFMRERHYGDFEDALVDTKALLKTGFLYDRRTRNVVAQLIPSSVVGDKDYQAFLQKVEKSLEKIYQDFMKDKKLVATNPKQFEERAGDYNISRRELIGIINDRLGDAGLRFINLSY